jgi:hypothetical protein
MFITRRVIEGLLLPNTNAAAYTRFSGPLYLVIVCQDVEISGFHGMPEQTYVHRCYKPE